MYTKAICSQNKTHRYKSNPLLAPSFYELHNSITTPTNTTFIINTEFNPKCPLL